MNKPEFIWKGIKIRIVDVTPEMAREILANHNELNRRMNMGHVKALAHNMKTGTWRFNGDTIRFDKDGNLIDGQHRLKAVILADMTITFIFAEGFDSETIKTIDQEIKPRNLSDLLKINEVENCNTIAGIINKYFVMKLSNASFLDSHRRSSGGGTSGPAGKARKLASIDEKFNEYANDPLFYEDLVVYVRKCYNNYDYLTPSNIGGMYAYLYKEKHHSHAEIKGFFDGLCLGLTDIKVISQLRGILNKDGRKNNRTPMTSSALTGYISKAWNYYLTNTVVNRLTYIQSKEGKIELL